MNQYYTLLIGLLLTLSDCRRSRPVFPDVSGYERRIDSVLDVRMPLSANAATMDAKAAAIENQIKRLSRPRKTQADPGILK